MLKFDLGGRGLINTNDIRDQQRSKVYAWERSLFPVAFDHSAEKMTLGECIQLIRRVEKHYKLGYAKVTPGIRCRIARGSKYHIILPRWSRSPWVVLHETAHRVVDSRIGNNRVPWHGEHFTGVYMYLLAKYVGAEYATLARTANDARIQFIPRDDCKPKNLRS